jgi:enoyl-[acyl-carrier-protein] reductase (NADH)
MVDGHILTVEDVADTVLFLASPLSDQVQGQTIVVDGGVGIRG